MQRALARCIATALLSAAIGAAWPATPASALVLERERSESGLFLLEGCGATDTDYLWTVESSPFDLRPIRPLVGAPIYDDETGEVVGRITDISVDDKGRNLVWTATGSDDLCSNPDFYGLSLSEVRLSMAFKFHQRIRTYRAEHALRKTLDRRFSFWRIGYLKRAECRGREPRWRCRVRFAAGDTSFSGKAKIKVRAVRNRPQFRVRYRIKRTNHYCIAVYDRPRSKCTKTYRGAVKI